MGGPGEGPQRRGLFGRFRNRTMDPVAVDRLPNVDLSLKPLEVLAQFLWHARAGVLQAVSHKPAARRVYGILIDEMSSWDSPNET